MSVLQPTTVVALDQVELVSGLDDRGDQLPDHRRLLLHRLAVSRQVDQGKALIVNKKGGPVVVFTGITVLPIIHRAEQMDISVRKASTSTGAARTA